MLYDERHRSVSAIKSHLDGCGPEVQPSTLARRDHPSGRYLLMMFARPFTAVPFSKVKFASYQ